MKKYLSSLFVLLIAIASASAQKKPIEVGADRDKHGCIGSAGYVYSIIRNDCIRVFEQNIQLKEVSPKSSSSSMVAVIFSKDSSKAEVFLPTYSNSQILLRKGYKGHYSWQKAKLVLIKNKNFEISENNKLIYKQQ